ncbi:ABC transporter ATP-binding protein [Spelaeicoccus albus]|uniref:Peptide/nickel transport system ATP-binding protein n=1 Tax=Spelaeicoccus albus TaxID=1280376 RepID=A0A7Z0D236_9MICO|nr:ABC transporter ATP-binding protein [Spelaeicoccus albus]NYI67452.1 peptide/nickel transport system ATP-binding protein [Spelaeicoccus albus]
MTDESQADAVLTVRDLRISTTAHGTEILHGVSFELQPGKILSLVGESGSGKTTAGLACMGHFRRGLSLSGGEVRLETPEGPADVLTMSEPARRGLRGGSISYVPQDPALSLNPAIRVGEQILEVMRVHGFGADEHERGKRVAEVLAEVGLPGDRNYQRRFPHQLSGGQQQRIGIAMAFACRPSVIVLDEPTTGLDVTTQALVLETIDTLTRRHDVAGLYITHDLAVVAEVADEVVVMLGGDIVERGRARDVLYSPTHSYTRKLLRAVPDLAGRNHIGTVDAVTDEHAVVVENSRPAAVGEPAGSVSTTAPETDDAVVCAEDISLSYGSNRVLDGVTLSLAPGESTMLLGESGSGKTTLSQCIAGLNAGFTGRVRLAGETLKNGTRQRTQDDRRRIQYVFQSPFSSLNPRRTIGESIAVPLEMNSAGTRAERRAKTLEALDQVRLGRQFVDRRPGELSGGERQRAAIARALVNTPSVLVCDEVTSALDVSVQASIVDLLRTLQVETGMAMLFVTHNIALARHISQRLAVLQKGKIVDNGPTAEVLDNPRHEYTRELLDNVPTI